MGQAKQRKIEIEQLKQNSKPTAIQFSFNIDDLKYSLLAVYSQEVINSMRETPEDADKCIEILITSSQNPIAVKNGAKVDASNEHAVKSSLRNIGLAVLRLALLDPYRSCAVLPDAIISLDLAEDGNGNVGFNHTGDGYSVLRVRRGVSRVQQELTKSREVDFITEIL